MAPREPRLSSFQRGYTKRWAKARLRFLAAHPLCHVCRDAGRVEVATVVDHLIPHRGDVQLFWNESNWSAKCKTHHDEKTRLEGWSAR